MTYTRRKFNSHIKSLVHFDYPYFNEAYDGCRDEITGNIFMRKGSVKFSGIEIPCDEIISGTPKFGYRCLHSQSQSDYIYAMNTGQFDIKSSGNYEFECFVRISSSSAGNIIAFMNEDNIALALSLNTENKLILISSLLEMNISVSSSLSINEWHHVKVQLQSGEARIIHNGEIQATSSYNPGDLSVSEIRIGGISGFIDEFILRDNITENTVPSAPYQGTCDVLRSGGFGNGQSSVTINANVTINSYALITKTEGKTLTLSDMTQSSYSDFTAGTEIMIHVTQKKTSAENELGLYAFRKIISVSGKIITLDSEVTDEFNLATCTENYYVQAITIPHFNSLTVYSGMTISPVEYSSHRGGIVIFRVLNSCVLNGSIITSGLGAERDDKLQMTHSELIDRFLINRGGGIYITCGGTFTCTNTSSRMGATWDGSANGGQPVARSKGTDGGAGYGGAGGSDTDNYGTGGKGGVGGGGGGGDGTTGGDAGQPGNGGISGAAGTGGGNADYARSRYNNPGWASSGGTAGINLNSEYAPTSGGGGAGGNAGNSYMGQAVSGASLILIAKKLHIEASSISTGGQGGNASNFCSGGGGTGFAYIACEEMN